MSAAIPNIQAWLAGPRDYAAGLELFRMYSNNEVLKKSLSYGENSWSRNKLLTELQALISVPDVSIIAKKAELTTPATPISAPVAEISTQPSSTNTQPAINESVRKVTKEDTIAALEKEWRLLYAEGAALNLEKFREDVPQKDREKAAARIVQIDDKCKEIWGKLDYYKENGTLPVEPVVKPKVNVDDRAELIKRRNTLRTYLTRYKNKPEKLQTFTNELEEIERRLGDA